MLTPDEFTAGGTRNVRAYMSRVALLIAAIAAVFTITYGGENGTGPCTLTAQQEEFNATLTEVTIAYSVVEASKIPGSLFAGYLAEFRTTLAWQMAGFAVLWAVGTVIIGAANGTIMMGSGYVIVGLGVAVINVAQPPLIDHVVPPPKKHRSPLLFSIIAAMGIVGIAVGFAACGATIERSATAWRWNFYVAAMLMLPAVIALLFTDWRVSVGRTELGDALFKPSPSKADKERTEQEEQKSLGSRCGEVVSGVAAVASIPAIRWTILSQTASLFAIAAYAALTPVFIERGLGHSKSTSGLVLAGVIPCIALATWAGGLVVRRRRWTIRKQLRFSLVTICVAAPGACVFLVPTLWAFVPLLIVVMVAAFLRTGPTVTLLAQAARRAVTGWDDDARHAIPIGEEGSVEDEDEDPCVREPSAFDGVTPTARNTAGEVDSNVSTEMNDAGESSISQPPVLTEPARDSIDADPQPASPRSPHLTHEEHVTVAKLTAYANGVGFCVTRVAGSVPGPIVLAALIDSEAVTVGQAFAIVGAVAGTFAVLFAVLAYREACPCQHSMLSHVDSNTESAESN